MADRESETAGLEETAARADKGSTQVPRMAGMAALVELADPALVDCCPSGLIWLTLSDLVDLADPALVDLAECSMLTSRAAKTAAIGLAKP